LRLDAATSCSDQQPEPLAALAPIGETCFRTAPSPASMVRATRYAHGKRALSDDPFRPWRGAQRASASATSDS